ncbi:IS1182 family transposase [Lysinibacillus pakistanensis]|uniref:IS1182 family transposase n=1 Tax=Lysinibacillus pakistanensis TaxID=759811 RepID=A0AAX3WP64_9BACI|nr:IS1182 family transposase [Lysinibacillus pakistanensis]WHY44614.1 IS1182 family transposase [Lysinibacillus pakistanensis]WHY49622.1 IS1182 family transposase [Lysinibacillus pakistanensis]
MYVTYSRREIEENRKFYEMMYDPSHQLVKMDQVMDWNFVSKQLEVFYPYSIGRPTKDPIMLVKILLIQYLEGFRSVRFTCKQVKQHATYRWFLGISPTEKIPDHSTISKFLSQRLQGVAFWEELFQHCLLSIHDEGFIANETWVADETELKANANKRVRNVQIEEKIIEEKEDDLTLINEHRARHGKKLLMTKEPKVEEKRTNSSPVDPEARLSVKHDERGRFAYFEHRIVDSLHNFIIATDVTAANVPGHRKLVGQVDQLKQLFGQYAKEIALDSGYYNAPLARRLFERKFFVYMSYRRFATKDHPNCRRYQFKQVNENLYACPCGVPFYYKTTNRQGYHEFKPPKGSCQFCPFVKRENEDRVLRISIHQEIYNQLRGQRLSYRGKILRSVRPATVELSFAHSKELHGLRYARYRGVQKVKRQVLMTAIIQNLKKWTKLRSLKQIGLHLTHEIIEESV